MATLPQSRSQWRFPRARLEGPNPAVLRFENGESVSANLKVISLTGGLLSVDQPVVQGAQVRLIFLTGAGAVLAGAEMLPPAGSGLQPFRFVSLEPDDHQRIEALIGGSSQDKSEQAWIEKLRSASERQREPRRWRFKVAEMVGMLMVGLAAAAYLLHFGPHFHVHLSLLN